MYYWYFLKIYLNVYFVAIKYNKLELCFNGFFLWRKRGDIGKNKEATTF